jgi:bacteriocin-like protein
MKTLFNINESKNSFSFDILSIDELASIKGGFERSREQDAYAELN